MFVHSLTALSKILDKAEAFAEAKKIKPEVIPQLRLIADMLPFWRQITIACDHAKGAPARLAGMDVPSFADTETTIAELKERIAKTIAFISTIPDAAFEGAEARSITVKAGPRELSFPAPQYLASYAICPQPTPSCAPTALKLAKVTSWAADLSQYRGATLPPIPLQDRIAP
jgi:hypothetical protein